VPVELLDDQPSDGASPFEEALRAETYQRYRDALTRLSSKERQLIVARVEACWSFGEISARFGLRTLDAARMAVTRALCRLREQLDSAA
jgi:DNA-directed RNA polymerase specialized sigma24 family protein